jgi:hypothetical protein
MKKMTFPRPALLAALVAATCCSSAYAGKTNDDKTPQDVLSYGLGLKAQRHSPLQDGQHPRTWPAWCRPGASPSAAKSSAARRRRRWSTTA